MTDSLIKNLRDLAAFAHADLSVADEAAAEIERLREALQPFADAANDLDRDGWDEGSIEGSLANVTAKHCRIARAALGEKE